MVNESSPDGRPPSVRTETEPQSAPATSADIQFLENSLSDHTEQLPVRWREILAVIALIVLSDITIYRGNGYAGFALMFIMGPLLLLIGSPRRSRLWGAISILGIMLLILAGAMLWCGSELQVMVGIGLFCAFGLTLSRVYPYVIDTIAFPIRVFLGGLPGLLHYAKSVRFSGRNVNGIRFLNVILPLVAFLTFSYLFLLANPDLFQLFGDRLERIFNSVRDWLLHWSPPATEFTFWLAVAWIAVGSLRPHLIAPVIAELVGAAGISADDSIDIQPASLYAACRNTLITVIVLFAVYLIFEFKTLWFRVFPVGFYYSGYAHQGAAWLTVALALATVILSLVFRGAIQRDPRLKVLRRLAWTWSLLNIILAIAVYHRLYIYIEFNGLTRMRIVGFFGMSAVLVGFLLVLWKIAANRNFIWLVHRHLWTLAVAVYLFTITPVDVLVVNYNVHKVLAGDLAPSVQVSVHEIDSAGFRFLHPLLNCTDDNIREGVRAMLAVRQESLETKLTRREHEGWTSFQASDAVLLRELQERSDDWAIYKDRTLRDQALNRFHDYAYQWY